MSDRDTYRILTEPRPSRFASVTVGPGTGLDTLRRMREDPAITTGLALAMSGRRPSTSLLPPVEKLSRAHLMAVWGLDVMPVEPLDPFPTFWPPLTTLAAFQEANRRRRIRDDHDEIVFSDGLCFLIVALFVVALALLIVLS